MKLMIRISHSYGLFEICHKANMWYCGIVYLKATYGDENCKSVLHSTISNVCLNRFCAIELELIPYIKMIGPFIQKILINKIRVKKIKFE